MSHDITCPAVAISPAGWHKAATTLSELTDASPKDDLVDWQNIEILDAEGMRFQARRAFLSWPRQSWAVLLCRLFNQSVHVGFEFSAIERMSTEEVAKRVAAVEVLPDGIQWTSPRQILEFVCA